MAIIPQLDNDAARLITGPQIPTANNYFDQTFLAKARQHGEALPDTVPANPEAVTIQGTTFNNHFYYDLPLVLYIAYFRTEDPSFLALARKSADLWWQHPEWIGSGRIRQFPDSATPAPRHAGLGGLMLRALDGRPEMWDWIVAYERAAWSTWIRVPRSDDPNPQLHYGLREGAFVLQGAAWLVKVLPDSFPNAAAIRAQFLADIENACVNYFGRLQHPDGSWRWNTGVDEYGDSKLALASIVPSGASTISIMAGLPESVPQGELIYFSNQDVLLKASEAVPAGSKIIPVVQLAPNAAWLPLQRSLPQGAEGQYAPLRGIMQPFMVGLTTSALIDAHEVVQTPTVKENIKNQILKACRHLYSDGPYVKDEIEQRSGRRIRGFHYFYHGGTSVNPTKYAKGDMRFPWTDLEGWWLASARQAISTILPAYGWAYKVSGDEFFKTAGEELWDSAYSGRDGARAMMDDTAKNFNQHARRVPSYRTWLGSEVIEPSPPSPPPPTPPAPPEPIPTPEPTPVPPASPTVTITSPTPEATLSGVATVTISVTNATGIAEVYLILDGQVAAGSSRAPFDLHFDTTRFADGSHAIFVRAWKNDVPVDSETISVSVKNTAGPQPEPEPEPTPVPTPPPVPVPQCKLSGPDSVTIPSGSMGVVTITIENMTGSGEVRAVPSSGQISVNPGLKKVSGTSASIQFQVGIKKRGGSIAFSSSGCGTKTVKVIVA